MSERAVAARAQGAAPAPARVAFVVGPTGSGKTALALVLAERLGAEIVNADSRQLYRGMDIGTAKPTSAERRRVPHHLIDVLDPGEAFDVARFAELAGRAIADIASRGRPALVAGGSGLYLRVLRHGLVPAPGADPMLRERLSAEARAQGVEALHQRLARIDPAGARRLSPNDEYRIVRALEVFELTGVALSAYQQAHRFAAEPYRALSIGLEVPRAELYRGLDQRFDAMLAAGLVEEVRALLGAGLLPDAPVLRTIGYKHLVAWLGGELSFARAVELAKRDTRRLAKRQLTWFRAQADIVWIDPRGALEQAYQLLAEFFAR